MYLYTYSALPDVCKYGVAQTLFFHKGKTFCCPISCNVILLNKVFYTVSRAGTCFPQPGCFCVFLHNGWYHRVVQFICRLEIILMLKDAICRLIIKNLNQTLSISVPTNMYVVLKQWIIFCQIEHIRDSCCGLLVVYFGKNHISVCVYKKNIF